MYSKLLTILLCTAMAVNAAASSVTRDEAAAIAFRFFNSLTGVNKSTRLRSVEPRQLSPSSGKETRAYYIFNADRGGYVIVSSDNRARAVLAYSDSGSIDPDNIPDGCAEWLKSYEAEITSLKDMPDNISTLSRGVSYPSVKVAPMVPSRWGQGTPYNDFCPVDKKTGHRSLTGCGATAMAQIMACHRYPGRPHGSVSYDDTEQDEMRTLDFDMEPAFDWNVMLDDGTAYGKEAIGRLMKCAAYGAEMKFSSQTSVSYLRTCSEALYRYFGYDRNICRYERDIMDDQAWIDMLVGELSAGRPVIYEGRAAAGEVGHIFVCDGYDGEGLFHINWGWEGRSDGYYSLSALTPSSQGLGGISSDYTRMQVVTANIAPDGMASPLGAQSGALYMDQLYISTGTSYEKADDGVTVMADAASSPGFFFYCWNMSYGDYNGEICAARVVDDAIVPLSMVPADIAAGRYSRDTLLPLDLSAIPADGCEVAFYQRRSAGSQWERVVARNGQSSSCHVSVAGDEVIFTPVCPEARVSLSGRFETGEMYAGRSKIWSFDIANDGDIRYEGYAGVMARNLSSGEVAMCTTPLFCIPGEKSHVSVSAGASILVAGQYMFTPFVSGAGAPRPEDISPLADGIVATVEVSPSVVVMPGGMSAVYSLDRRNPEIVVSMTNMGASAWSGMITGFISQPDMTQDVAPFTVSAQVSLSPGHNDVRFDASAVDIPAGESCAVEWCLGSTGEFPLTSGVLVVSDSGSEIGATFREELSVSDSGEVLTVRCPGNVSVTIIDMAGRAVCHLFADREVSIPKTGLAGGIYLLHINGGGESRTIRLVIK